MEMDEELKVDEEEGRGRNRAGERRGNRKVVGRGGNGAKAGEGGGAGEVDGDRVRGACLPSSLTCLCNPLSLRDLSLRIAHVHLLSLQSTFCTAVPETFPKAVTFLAHLHSCSTAHEHSSGATSNSFCRSRQRGNTYLPLCPRHPLSMSYRLLK